MNSTLFIDEPTIIPFAPSETLVRLMQISGALQRNSIAPFETLQSAQTALQNALAKGDLAQVRSTLHLAQTEISALYESVKADPTQCAALGFPPAEFLSDEYSIAPVNVQTVTATFTLRGKQIHTSLAFERAANVKFYWLHEVRHFAENPEQRVEDPLVETSSPFFDRLRLPSGPRVLRIKSRNLSASVLSEEFTIEVPFL